MAPRRGASQGAEERGVPSGGVRRTRRRLRARPPLLSSPREALGVVMVYFRASGGGLRVQGRWQRRTGRLGPGPRKGVALLRLRSKRCGRGGAGAGHRAMLGARALTLTTGPCPLPPQPLSLFCSETLLPLPVGLGELRYRWPGSTSAWRPPGPWPQSPALGPSGPPAQVQA